MMVELSFMFIIILGRWLLPKGNISHSALSQLLLVYLSLASDILDLLTLFNEKEIYHSWLMVHVVLLAFSVCMFQFALNLTATRGRSFHAEFDETEVEVHRTKAGITSATVPDEDIVERVRSTSLSVVKTPDIIYENPTAFSRETGSIRSIRLLFVIFRAKSYSCFHFQAHSLFLSFTIIIRIPYDYQT